MPDKVKPIPEGFHTITPHITVRDAAGAIEFYKKALNAQVLQVSHTPNGKVMHASLKIGDSILMLNDEFPEWGGALAPRGEVPGFAIHIYVDNVDKLFAQAVSAGGTLHGYTSAAGAGAQYAGYWSPQEIQQADANLQPSVGQLYKLHQRNSVR